MLEEQTSARVFLVQTKITEEEEEDAGEGDLRR